MNPHALCIALSQQIRANRLKKVTTAVGNTTAAASFTVLHELPEKLPIAQCVRLAISESFANVIHKSVIAEQI